MLDQAAPDEFEHCPGRLTRDRARLPEIGHLAVSRSG
jgi:hypothetical protein